jgi:hypothetical protein
VEGGGGVRLGLHVVHIRPISTRELAAACTRPLGCDLNSKFFSIISCEFNGESKSKSNMIIGLSVMNAHY